MGVTETRREGHTNTTCCLERESNYEQWKPIDTREKMPDFEDGATMKRGRQNNVEDLQAPPGE